MSSYAKLISRIKKYESDTFSASNAALTNSEAEKVADLLIKIWTENRLDGVLVASALAEVRDPQ